MVPPSVVIGRNAGHRGCKNTTKMRKYLILPLLFFLFPFVSHASVLYSQTDSSTATGSYVDLYSHLSTSVVATTTVDTVVDQLDTVWGKSGIAGSEFYHAKIVLDDTSECTVADGSLNYSIGYGVAEYGYCFGSSTLTRATSTVTSVVGSKYFVSTVFSNFVIPSGHSYKIEFSGYYHDYTGIPIYIYGTSGGSPYAVLTSSFIGPVFVPSTRIFSLLPSATSTVATSSPVTFGGTVYVLPSDYIAGSTLHMEVTNEYSMINCGNSSINPVICGQPQFVLDVPITASSTDLYLTATTTLSLLGRTSVKYSVRRPSSGCTFWIFGCTGGDDLVTVYQSFVFGGKSNFDINVDLIGRSAAAETDLASTTPATELEALCNPIGSYWSILGCAKAFVIPTDTQWRNVASSTKGIFLNTFPFGFAERFVTIATGQASSTVALPVINYTFGSSTPLNGTNYTFALFTDEKMNKLATIYTDQGDGKNLWDIVDPWFYTISYVSVFLVILTEVLGLELERQERAIDSVNMRERIDRVKRSSFKRIRHK